MMDQSAPDQAEMCTAMARLDADGRICAASGELRAFDRLEDFLDGVAGVLGANLASNKATAPALMKRWGDPVAAPVEILRKDGTRRLLTSYIHEDGGPVYLSIATAGGDGETGQARELLADAIESISEGFALYDEDDRLVICNDRYREMNRAVEEVIQPGMSWEMLMRTSARRGVYKEAIGREEEWVSERLANGIEYIRDYELRHTDGSAYLVSVHPTKLGGFVVTRTDITAMKQAEAAERDSDLLVRKVLDSSSAVVIMARIGDGHILYQSPAANELFGEAKDAATLYVNQTDRADYVTEILVDGRVDDFRVEAYRPNGEIFNASLSGRIAEFKGEEVIVSHIRDLTPQLETEAMIRKVLEACPVPVQMTRADSGETLFRSPDAIALFGDVGNAYRYYANPGDRERYLELLYYDGYVENLKIELINVRGEKFWGAISSRLIDFRGDKVIVSNTRDLTDELALQEELTQQRELLFQNEKMSALGELLAGVAHELNNPLSVVVGHSLMLREETDDQSLLDRIEKISRSAERCAKIVKTFLAMARQRPARLEPLDIDSLLKTAADVMGYSLGGQETTITTEVAPGIPEIRADPEQITQVIINLVINAQNAIADSGKGGAIVIAAGFNRKSRMLEISVSDDGPGIPDAIKPRIFEPFFTTKDVGKGTGIGLAFCHRTIHSHNGRIWLDPDHRDGSRFVIALPAGDEPPLQPAADAGKAAGLAGVRALVVDDEEDVADLISEILRRDGCAVTIATSGAEALEHLGRGGYDVVLSDLNMPEMDGRGLFDAIRQSHREMAGRIAFITGDSMGPASQKFLGESKSPYLEKPISPIELRKLVQGLLDGNRRDGNAKR